MGRKKRTHPLLSVARTYLNQHMPELKTASLHLRMLDGPPGSPRYAVTAEECQVGACPFGTLAGECTVRDCPLRCSVRLLLDRRGTVVQATRSGIHWN